MTTRIDSSTLLTYRGKTMSIYAWSRVTKMRPIQIIRRKQAGWSDEEALNNSAKPKKFATKRKDRATVAAKKEKQQKPRHTCLMCGEHADSDDLWSHRDSRGELCRGRFASHDVQA